MIIREISITILHKVYYNMIYELIIVPILKSLSNEYKAYYTKINKIITPRLKGLSHEDFRLTT